MTSGATNIMDEHDPHALSAWVEKLDDMLQRQQQALEHESTRAKIAAQIVRALEAINSARRRGEWDPNGEERGRACTISRKWGPSPCPIHPRVIKNLLTTTKVLMRDRRGIQDLLRLETLDLFLQLAESPDVAIGEEAMKCVINSVYSRPDFVRDTALPGGFAQRVLELARRVAPASYHLMVWKALLVSCEATEMALMLVNKVETWRLIYATLGYCLHAGDEFPIGQERGNLVLDIAKLVAVLVNELRLPVSDDGDRNDDLIQSLQLVGDVLLDIVSFCPFEASAYDATLIDIKNKVVEVFMFVRPELLGIFVQRQNQALSAILEHFYTMLILVRIEKTRLLKDILPVLIACHHLTSTGDSGIKRFFKQRVFPQPKEGSNRPPQHPAAPSFFHKHLTYFLTCLDTSVKRYTGEWLYLLCDENADEYTKHTGLGNAIGLLRIKGLA